VGPLNRSGNSSVEKSMRRSCSEIDLEMFLDVSLKFGYWVGNPFENGFSISHNEDTSGHQCVQK